MAAELRILNTVCFAVSLGGVMIKRIINPTSGPQPGGDPRWLPLDDIAEVEITSEQASYPIERALNPGDRQGWRADRPGEQTIRLTFPTPRELKHVRIVIEENERERTQQFVLRAAPATTGMWREIARQQFNFSPAGATREQEDYRVDLPAIGTLELTITPDISGRDAVASLQQLRVA